MGAFWLEFEQGGGIQQAAFESHSVTIGRDRTCDFVLDHPTVSRQHALIVHQGGGVYHLVVMSRGGLTAVDGQPPRSQEVQIFDGTMLTLGQYSLRFRSNQSQPRPGGPSAFGAQSSAVSGQGAGAQGAGGVGSMVPKPAAPVVEDSDEEEAGPGIVTWDEIASSSEAMDEEEEVREVTDFDRIQAAKKGKEESNPVIVIGGLVLAVGVVVVALLVAAGGKDSGERQVFVEEDTRPVEIDVRCLDEGHCRREALLSYERAINLLERQEVETGNLFEGYKRLLEAKAYIEQTASGTMPEEMKDWDKHHDQARAELDSLFRSWRMEFHNALSRNRYEEMAGVLLRIEAYFPDRTAYEARWARDREQEMKSEGVFPARPRVR